MMIKEAEHNRLAQLIDFVPEEKLPETVFLALNVQDADELRSRSESAGVSMSNEQAGAVFNLINGTIELEDDALEMLSAGWHVGY